MMLLNFDVFVYILLALLSGILLGCEIMRRHYYSKIIGNLRVDQSITDDNPYLFLEVTKGSVESIRKDKYVMLRVKDENYISQE